MDKLTSGQKRLVRLAIYNTDDKPQNAQILLKQVKVFTRLSNFSEP